MLKYLWQSIRQCIPSPTAATFAPSHSPDKIQWSQGPDSLSLLQRRVQSLKNLLNSWSAQDTHLHMSLKLHTLQGDKKFLPSPSWMPMNLKTCSSCFFATVYGLKTNILSWWTLIKTSFATWHSCFAHNTVKNPFLDWVDMELVFCFCYLLCFHWYK